MRAAGPGAAALLTRASPGAQGAVLGRRAENPIDLDALLRTEARPCRPGKPRSSQTARGELARGTARAARLAPPASANRGTRARAFRSPHRGSGTSRAIRRTRCATLRTCGGSWQLRPARACHLSACCWSASLRCGEGGQLAHPTRAAAPRSFAGADANARARRRGLAHPGRALRRAGARPSQRRCSWTTFALEGSAASAHGSPRYGARRAPPQQRSAPHRTCTPRGAAAAESCARFRPGVAPLLCA